MKPLIWILTILILATAAMAAECDRNEDCTIYGQFKIDGQPTEISAANITITKNQALILQNSTINAGNGTFIYILNVNVSGEYLARFTYYNGSETLGTSEETIKVNDGLTELSLILLILGMTAAAIYLYRNIKTEEIPVGRVPEKMMFYTLGLTGVLFGAFMVYNIGKEVTYMVIPTQIYLIVTLILVGASVYLYFVYLLEMWLKWRNARAEEE